MARLELRCTDDELAAVRTAAEDAGMSVSEYVRQAALAPGTQHAAHALADVYERLAELEAWHARSKEERAAWEARGWVSPSKDGRDKVPMKLAREI